MQLVTFGYLLILGSLSASSVGGATGFGSDTCTALSLGPSSSYGEVSFILRGTGSDIRGIVSIVN